MSRLRVADANVVRPEHLQLARRHDRRSSGDADERQYGETAARYFVPSAFLLLVSSSAAFNPWASLTGSSLAQKCM